MRNSGLKYLVAIALIINAATLIFFWYNRPPEEGRRRPPRPDRVLIEELKLDDKQQAIYAPLREQHHQTHDSLLKLMAAPRQALYSQKQGANDTIIHQIGLLQEQIERVTYDHFMEVRKLCTPEQQVQLDVLLGKTVQIILTPKKKKGRPENEH